MVLDVPVSVVAQDAVRELRLVLLSPDELTTLERENAKDDLIPVRCWDKGSLMVQYNFALLTISSHY